MTANKVIVHTDGACSGNPGPGGWGVILEYNGTRKELSGGEALTTNNRMELMGAISALEIAEAPLRGGDACRFQLREGRHHQVDSRLEEEWLEDRRQEAGEERRTLAAPRRRPSHRTRFPGTGSKATPATTTTNAPTNWPAKAWRRSSGDSMPIVLSC